MRLLLPAFLLLVASVHLAAAEVSEIDNYRQYSADFSSSGQPSAEQLQALSEAGFKRVIYLAFTDNKTAIESEDRVVKSLGMDYLHIPVDFEHPAINDFEDFAAVLNRDKNIRTLLHCQINLRASTFSFLYRVIYGGVPVPVAKSDLDAIWQPDRVWYRFIAEVMEAHGLSPECEECDWGNNVFTQ
ncbi:MAG TPA: protein tyrosine phosphatase family protein [Xanthomonadales bacterium]